MTEDVLKQSPLFKDGDPVFLDQVIMALRPIQAAIVLKRSTLSSQTCNAAAPRTPWPASATGV